MTEAEIIDSQLQFYTKIVDLGYNKNTKFKFSCISEGEIIYTKRHDEFVITIFVRDEELNYDWLPFEPIWHFLKLNKIQEFDFEISEFVECEVDEYDKED